MSCISSIGRGIEPDCANPKIAGFEPQAIIYQYDQFVQNMTITYSATHPEQITDVSSEGEDEYGVRCTVYGENPYNGTNEALTREDGVEKWIHQVALRIADRGVASVSQTVEPLARGRHIVVLKTNDGKVFVHGLHGVLKTTEQTHNEYENNGDWMVTLQSKEPYAAVEIVGGQTSARVIFDRLFNNASQG